MKVQLQVFDDQDTRVTRTYTFDSKEFDITVGSEDGDRLYLSGVLAHVQYFPQSEAKILVNYHCGQLTHHDAHSWTNSFDNCVYLCNGKGHSDV